MNLNLLHVPNYKVNFWITEPTTLLYVKFIRVVFKEEGRVEKHIFNKLSTLVNSFNENEMAYNFVEFQLKEKESKFSFVSIDKQEKIIQQFMYNKFPNKWEIFFNSKDNIVVHDPFFPSKTGHRYLRNNRYYNNVDFYVGISSLVDIIKNTTYEYFEEIIPILNLKRETIINLGVKEYIEDTLESVSADENGYLNHLIGLENVKKEISALQVLAAIRLMKIKRSIPVSPTTLHMVFTGNPGTGKTSVARLIGKIYKEIGLLQSGHLIEVTSGELEAKYVGHSAPQTKEYFEKAINGVLFIDEAYSLFKNGNNFGKEVIDTLVKLMEDNRENIVVIIAGYPNEMKNLLDKNIGFKDRFSTFINFDDYSKSELKEILLQMVINMKHSLTNGASYKFDYLLDEYFEKGYFKSNARTVRNIFEEIQKRQSLRLSKLENPTDKELITFTDTDIPDALN